MDYTTFIQSCRKHQKNEGASELKRMFLLVEIRPLAAVWMTGPYKSWSALLKGENLCAPSRYDQFERATQVFKKTTIESVGVDAAVILARVEEPLQDLVFQKIKEFVAETSSFPRARTVWSWVHSLRLVALQEATPSRNHRAVRH